MSDHADTIRKLMSEALNSAVSEADLRRLVRLSEKGAAELDALVVELEAARQETLEARAAVAEIEGAYERLVEHDNRRAIVLAYEARGEALRRVTAERNAAITALEKIAQATNSDPSGIKAFARDALERTGAE